MFGSFFSGGQLGGGQQSGAAMFGRRNQYQAPPFQYGLPQPMGLGQSSLQSAPAPQAQSTATQSMGLGQNDFWSQGQFRPPAPQFNLQDYPLGVTGYNPSPSVGVTNAPAATPAPQSNPYTGARAAAYNPMTREEYLAQANTNFGGGGTGFLGTRTHQTIDPRIVADAIKRGTASYYGGPLYDSNGNVATHRSQVG